MRYCWACTQVVFLKIDMYLRNKKKISAEITRQNSMLMSPIVINIPAILYKQLRRLADSRNPATNLPPRFHASWLTKADSGQKPQRIAVLLAIFIIFESSTLRFRAISARTDPLFEGKSLSGRKN
jgi:hypothetical protein